MRPETSKSRVRLGPVVVERASLRAYPVTYWDDLASDWDRVVSNPRNPHQFYYREADILMSQVLALSMRVLELGCGTGGSTDVHSREVERLVATDVSIDMVRRARTRLQKKGRNLDVARCDACHLPFHGSAFDAVISRGVLLSYVSRPAAALAEARRVVRRGGWLALDAMNRLVPSGAHPFSGFQLVGGRPAYVELSVKAGRQVRRVSFLSRGSPYGASARQNRTCRAKPKRIARYVIGTARYEARLFTPPELRALAEGAGFRRIRVVPLGHFAHALRNEIPHLRRFARRNAAILSELAVVLADHLRPQTALHLMLLAKKA